MAEVKTMRVVHREGGHLALINAADFDPAVWAVAKDDEPEPEPEQEQPADPEGDANDAPDSPQPEESEAAPVPSIEGLNVGQVARLLAKVKDADVLDAIAEAESADKDRKGVHAAIAERREELES